MKKITTILFVTLLSTMAYNSAEAQFRTVGVGLMYGTEIEKIGLRVDGVYQINEEFRATADLGLFLPEKESFGNAEVKSSMWELNANGNYIFFADADQGMLAYALAGLNFTTLKTSVDGFGPQIDGSDSNTEVGLNIGAGMEYNLDFANLFGEIKYVLGDYDQLNIGVGLRFAIGN